MYQKFGWERLVADPPVGSLKNQLDKVLTERVHNLIFGVRKIDATTSFMSWKHSADYTWKTNFTRFWANKPQNGFFGHRRMNVAIAYMNQRH